MSLNSPPFLSNGKFTESEVSATKEISENRIHVERVNAGLKEFTPQEFCQYAAAAVLCLDKSANLLIREIASTLVVDYLVTLFSSVPLLCVCVCVCVCVVAKSSYSSYECKILQCIYFYTTLV